MCPLYPLFGLIEPLGSRSMLLDPLHTFSAYSRTRESRVKMKDKIVTTSLFATVLCSAYASETYPACPPLSGDVTINLPNIYPESADFSLSNCKFYIGLVHIKKWD